MSVWIHVHATKDTVVLNVSRVYVLTFSSSTRLTFVMEEETVHTLMCVNVNMVIQDACVNMWSVTEEWMFIHSSVQHMAYVFNQIHVSVTTVGQVRTVSIQFASVSRPMKQMFVAIMADVSHQTCVNVIMDIMAMNARIQVALVSCTPMLNTCAPLTVLALDPMNVIVRGVGCRETVAFQLASEFGEQIIPCARSTVFVPNQMFVFVVQAEQEIIVS